MKVPQKNIFGHFCMFGLVKGHFGLLGPKNGSPSGQTATYWKTSLTSRYGGLMIPFSRIRVTQKNGCYNITVLHGCYNITVLHGCYNITVLHGCGVKKIRFWNQFWALAPPQELAQHYDKHKNLSFWCPVMMAAKI